MYEWTLENVFNKRVERRKSLRALNRSCCEIQNGRHLLGWRRVEVHEKLLLSFSSKVLVLSIRKNF